MTFNEWYEKNKESLTASTIVEGYRKAWKSGWENALEKHYMEAYNLGKEDGRKEI